jgi:ribosomal protein S18 acetylase RimI-like enzyme
MQAITAAVWKRHGPRVLTHIGDIPWWLYQHTPAVADPKEVVLFEREGRAVAWAVLWLPQTCFFALHADEPADELHDVVLTWFEASAGDDVDGGLDVAVLESDRSGVEALERRGYDLRTGVPWMEHRVRSLAEPVERADAPPGYTVRSLRGDADVPERVEVHRAAFAPSRVTVDSYRTIRTLYPHRDDLDIVVEAPDGSFAAFAHIWLDEANGVGELEPVGTHPAHRGLGLARAACFEGLSRLRDPGASTAVVYSVSGTGAGELYDSVGLHAIDRHLEYRLPV